MYVNAFWLGVLSALFVEMLIFTIVVIWVWLEYHVATRNRRRRYKEE